jgi:hypothetical protein
MNNWPDYGGMAQYANGSRAFPMILLGQEWTLTIFCVTEAILDCYRAYVKYAIQRPNRCVPRRGASVHVPGPHPPGEFHDHVMKTPAESPHDHGGLVDRGLGRSCRR